jgi:hypothetical protein
MPYIHELKFEGTMYLSETDAKDAIVKHGLFEPSCKIVSDILPAPRSTESFVCFGYRIRITDEKNPKGHFFTEPNPYYDENGVPRKKNFDKEPRMEVGGSIGFD